jgi:hypothetical protein
MKNLDLRPTPTLRRVLVEQIRVVGPSLRGLGIALGAFLAMGTIMILLTPDPNPIRFELNYFVFGVLAFIGATLPLFLWWGPMSPFQPGFPWTLPVERARHTLARVAAGWVWLMAGVAVFVLWTASNSLLSGGALVAFEIWMVAPHRGAPVDLIDPATLPTMVWAQPGWFFLVPFVAATVVYLLASALFLATRYPGRWIAGTLLGTFLLALLVEWADLGWLSDALDPPLSAVLVGWYGLTTFIGGGTFEATVTRGPTGELMPVWMSVPTFGRWAISAALWTPAAFAALGLAILRHRDGRRGQASA